MRLLVSRLRLLQFAQSSLLAISCDLWSTAMFFHILNPHLFYFASPNKFIIFGITKYTDPSVLYNFGSEAMKKRKLPLGDRNMIGARVTEARNNIESNYWQNSNSRHRNKHSGALPFGRAKASSIRFRTWRSDNSISIRKKRKPPAPG